LAVVGETQSQPVPFGGIGRSWADGIERRRAWAIPTAETSDVVNNAQGDGARREFDAPATADCKPPAAPSETAIAAALTQEGACMPERNTQRRASITRQQRDGLAIC